MAKAKSVVSAGSPTKVDMGDGTEEAFRFGNVRVDAEKLLEDVIPDPEIRPAKVKWFGHLIRRGIESYGKAKPGRKKRAKAKAR